MTQCLRLGDMEAATEQKRRLEEKQRAEERKRENLRAPWRPKYFIQEVTRPASGAGWAGCPSRPRAGQGGRGRTGHRGRGPRALSAGCPHVSRGGAALPVGRCTWGPRLGTRRLNRDRRPAALPSIAN